MKIQFILTIALLFAFSFPNLAQGQFIIKKGNKYMLENNVYTKEDLGIVFKNSPQAMLYYQKGISKGETARTLFTVGTTMIGASALIIGILALDNSSNRSISASILAILSSVTLFSVGIIVDLISIPIYSSARSNMKNAVNHYNWTIENQPKNEVGSIHLGITNHGLGLVYSF